VVKSHVAFLAQIDEVLIKDTLGVLNFVAVLLLTRSNNILANVRLSIWRLLLDFM